MPTKKPSPKVGKPQDAVALLKADHAQVKAWFGEFEKTRSSARKQQLAKDICLALKVHTKIEEEIFYPAFLQATKDKDMHHEAIVEHDGAGLNVAGGYGHQPGDQGTTQNILNVFHDVV